MKIRLMGTLPECTAALTALGESPRLSVVEVSDPYPNRGESDLVRVYVEARPTERGERDERRG